MTSADFGDRDLDNSINLDRVLAIDTSSSYTELALRLDASNVITSSTSCVNSHDEELAELVDQLLKSAHLQVKELNAIVIGSGPGSFTGLRIGYAFAKGLATSSNITLYQVGSLEALLWDGVNQDCLIVGLADARRDEWFYSTAIIKSGVPTKREGPAILSAAELNNHVLNITKSEKLSVLGRSIIELGEDALALSFKVIKSSQFARNLLSEFDYSYRNGNLVKANKSEEYALITPQYVRKVAAKTIAERSKDLTSCLT